MRASFKTLTTIVLLVGTAVLGTVALPVTGAPGTPLTYAVPGTAPAGSELSVFRVGAIDTVSRVGRATQTTDGILDVRLYDDMDAANVDGSVAVMLQADGRLLWALNSKANKARIESAIDGFVKELLVALEQIASSDVFRDQYEQRFEAIFRRNLETTVASAEVDAALKQVLALLDEAFDNAFIGEYLALIARRGVGAAKEFLYDLGSILWGKSDDAAQQPIKERLRKILDTPEGRELIMKRLQTVLRSKETGELMTVFGRAFLANLIRDAEFLKTVQQVAAEKAFAGRLSAVERSGVRAIKRIARLLVGVDRDDRMHPLAATILRSLLFEDRRWIVAYVTPDLLDTLQRTTPDGVVALRAQAPK